MDESAALSEAFELHRAGHRAEAEAALMRLVALHPENARYMHLAGVAAYERGNFAVAAERFHLAIALQANFPEAYKDLANALRQLGRPADAAASCRRAIELAPDYADAHKNLGIALQDLGDFVNSIASCTRAVELQPDNAEALNDLGNAFVGAGLFDRAMNSFARALQLKPTLAEAHYNLGNVYKRRTLMAEAAREFQEAIALKPAFTEAINNLGTVLEHRGDLRGAEDCYWRALGCNPDYAVAIHNVGELRRRQGVLSEARHFLRRATELDPSYAEAHQNQSTLRMLGGELGDGWIEYEWRWKTGHLPARGFRQPRWSGEPLAGKTILVWAEQGLGDTLQFVRYAAMVKRQGATVVFECQPALMPLLSVGAGSGDPRTTLARLGIDRLIGQRQVQSPRSKVQDCEDPHPGALPEGDGGQSPSYDFEFDYQIPLLSLPGVFKTTLETIPAQVPYLFVDAALVAGWRTILDEMAAAVGEAGRSGTDRPTLVGINWQGQTDKRAIKGRNIPVAMFESLVDVPGVRLVSLQKNEEPLCTARPAIIDLGEFDTVHGAFMDTAAIMMNLDLVITSDTSVAHLAGALGVPVWVALPFVPDWRWLLERSDSPWYPTMRLFRQKSLGEWAGVFEEIRAALAERVKGEAGDAR